VTIPASLEAGFKAKFAEYTRTLDCVHCGLCIQNCPTYGVTGRESDSPRGRIYLMRGYAESDLEISPEARRHLDQCIVCRGCETVCPSGIRMGDMMESFRHEMRRTPSRRFLTRLLDRLKDAAARSILMGVLPHRARIAALTDFLYFYDRTGLRRLFRWAARLGSRGPAHRFFGRLSARLAGLDGLLPPILPPSRRRIDAEAAASGGLFRAAGKARVRAALFLGCISSEWYADVHRATIRVLTENGCDVLVPAAQTCCGALHRHGGHIEDAADLYARNRDAFAEQKSDVLIVNAAGCGASLREPPHSMPEGLGLPVRDVCEFLDEIGIRTPSGEIPRKVAHHQACHLVHAQRVQASAVENLLARIPGLSLVPLPDADRCCGAGGIYNLLHPEMAEPLQAEKVAAILGTGAEIVATGNPGCWLQIRAGLNGRGVEVLHPVELLARAYGSRP